MMDVAPAPGPLPCAHAASPASQGAACTMLTPLRTSSLRKCRTNWMAFAFGHMGLILLNAG